LRAIYKEVVEKILRAVGKCVKLVQKTEAKCGQHTCGDICTQLNNSNIRN